MPEQTYTVEGTDTDSGLATRIRVQALSPRLAAAEAADRGVTVAKVLRHDPMLNSPIPCDFSEQRTDHAEHQAVLISELLAETQRLHATLQSPPPQRLRFWSIAWPIIAAQLLIGIASVAIVIALILAGVL